MRRKILFAGLCLSLVAAGVSLSIQSAQAATKTQTFTNGAGITINDNTAAAPYPSTIEVLGFKKGKIRKVVVKVNDLSHTCANGDVDIMLAGPFGQQVVLLSDYVTSGALCDDLNQVDVTFTDAAGSTVPDPLVSGSYRPTDKTPGANSEFPGSTSLNLSRLGFFKGTDPNGEWRLFVRDDQGGDIGAIGSWSLKITAEVK